VVELLAPQYEITLLFYNPNIAPLAEYEKRACELGKLPAPDGYPNPVDMIVCDYDDSAFIAAAELYPDEPEGGLRCRACFELRLRETARRAGEGGFDFFVTTLSVSPHKDAALLNELGNKLAEQYGVAYLSSDFKKKGGYKKSVELSKKFELYRQGYCGCLQTLE
jgi:hypothetical protein